MAVITAALLFIYQDMPAGLSLKAVLISTAVKNVDRIWEC